MAAAARHYSFNPSDEGEMFVWSPRYDPDIVAEDPYAACDSGGYYERMAYSTYIMRALTDCTETALAVSIQPPGSKSSVLVNMQKPEQL